MLYNMFARHGVYIYTHSFLVYTDTYIQIKVVQCLPFSCSNKFSNLISIQREKYIRCLRQTECTVQVDFQGNRLQENESEK